MGEVVLPKNKYNGRIRKWILETEHIIVYKYLEACFLHHFHVHEVFDLATLSIRNYSIPQSVDPSKEHLIPFLYPCALYKTTFLFLIPLLNY
jgi:hypothetical protein